MLYNAEHGRVGERVHGASGRWGYGRAVFGGVLGAVTGSVIALLAGVFVATLLAWTGQPSRVVEALLLGLPPLGAVLGCTWALRTDSQPGAWLSAGVLAVLAPLAPLALWSAGTLLGTDNLWSLRIVPVLVLVLGTLFARALSLVLLHLFIPDPRRDAEAQLEHTL